MANRVLTIVAKVKDAASAGLNQIQNSLKKTGSAANQTSMDFTKFNKVMFSTTAYVGLFTRSFSKFGDALLQGSQFDRITSQFERVMGPKGDLFDAIAGFTDNSIDKVEALRSAIQMKALGIAKNTSEAAELIARAGTAAKLAGMDSGEGIKHFTSFLKDGHVANLEFLNLIRSADPALKLQMAMIEKMGGVLGGAMNAQMKYNMGLRLLRMATDGAMKGQRDLYDSVFDIRQAFTLLKSEVGIFIGTAISGLIDKVTHAVDKFTLFLENVRNTKKELLFLAKAIVVVSGAVAGFMAVFGTLRLAAIGLGALGISVTPLIYLVGTLLTVFTALTYKVKEGATPLERFTEKLRVFAGVIKGVYQLVTSYLSSQDNMRKGIGQIDRDLYELLNKNGLFLFVQRTAKAIAVIARFGISVFKQLVTWAKELDEVFGKLGNKFAEFFGVNKKLDVDLNATGNKIDEPHIKRLSSMWVDANGKVYGFLKKGAAALIVAFTLAKVLGLGKNFLSHVPLLGRLFKSGGNKPDGTKSNPLHVLMDNTLMDKLFGSRLQGPVREGEAALGRAGGGLVSKLVAPITGAIGNFLGRNVAVMWLSAMGKFFQFSSAISEAWEAVLLFGRGLTIFEGFQVVHIALAALGLLTGTIQGLVENFSSFTDAASNSYDYLKSLNIGDMIVDLFNSLGQMIYAKVSEAFAWIAPYITAVLAPFKGAFDTLAGWVNIAAEALKGFYEKLLSIPGVGALVSATVAAVTNPFGTMQAFGKEGMGALGAGADLFSNMTRNATAKNFLNQADTSGTLPFMPATSDERSDYAMRAIQQASGLEQQRMAKAYREAQEGTSAGGKEITAEEFARIFSIALNNSNVAKHTKETATETKKGNQDKAMKSRRGGC